MGNTEKKKNFHMENRKTFSIAEMFFQATHEGERYGYENWRKTWGEEEYEISCLNYALGEHEYRTWEVCAPLFPSFFKREHFLVPKVKVQAKQSIEECKEALWLKRSKSCELKSQTCL